MPSSRATSLKLEPASLNLARNISWQCSSIMVSLAVSSNKSANLKVDRMVIRESPSHGTNHFSSSIYCYLIDYNVYLDRVGSVAAATRLSKLLRRT